MLMCQPIYLRFCLTCTNPVLPLDPKVRGSFARAMYAWPVRVYPYGKGFDMVKRLSKALGVLAVALLAICAFALPARAASSIDVEGETAYLLSFDLPEGVTFEKAYGTDGPSADFIRPAYAVENSASTVTKGFDYYCWADKTSFFELNIASGYVVSDLKLSPESAGEVGFEADSRGTVLVSLTAPATLKVSVQAPDWSYVDTDNATGVSVNFYTTEAVCVKDATLTVDKYTSGKVIAKAQDAIQTKLAESGDTFSPDELVAYDVFYKDAAGNYVIGGLAPYVAFQHAYVTIPLPSGWDAASTRVYRYFEEAEDYYYADVQEASVVNGGAALKLDVQWCLGRFVLACEGAASPVHAPGWDKDADGDWVYYNNDGSLHTGWFDFNGNWIYFADDGKLVVNGWAYVGSTRYYMGTSALLAKNQWAQVDGEWYYIGSNYQPVTKGWAKVGSTYYYMDANGHVTKTGWASYNGKYYYIENYKVVVNDWRQVSGTWYHFNKSGVCDRVWNG